VLSGGRNDEAVRWYGDNGLLLWKIIRISFVCFAPLLLLRSLRARDLSNRVRPLKQLHIPQSVHVILFPLFLLFECSPSRRVVRALHGRLRL
jgi:hypothetical protein